jgi:hypothetical protein
MTKNAIGIAGSAACPNAAVGADTANENNATRPATVQYGPRPVTPPVTPATTRPMITATATSVPTRHTGPFRRRRRADARPVTRLGIRAPSMTKNGDSA